MRLHFESHDIEVINIDNRYQPFSACISMFSLWLEGYGRKPVTWRTLIIVLKEANLSILAEELEKMFSAGMLLAAKLLGYVSIN